jgi:hypothetical protein
LGALPVNGKNLVNADGVLRAEALARAAHDLPARNERAMTDHIISVLCLLANNSGIFAMLVAIRLASLRVKIFAVESAW